MYDPPPLNTNYLDISKPLMAAAAIQQAQVQNELNREKLEQSRETRNALRGLLEQPSSPGTGQPTGMGDVAQRTGQPNYLGAAQKMASIGNFQGAEAFLKFHALTNKDAETKGKEATALKTNIENFTTLAQQAKANPSAYPNIWRNAGQAGIELMHPKEFVGPDGSVDIAKFNKYVDDLAWGAVDAAKRLESQTAKTGPTLYGPDNTMQASVIRPGETEPRPVGGTASKFSDSSHLTAKADRRYEELTQKEQLGQALSDSDKAEMYAYEMRKWGQTGGIQPFSEWQDRQKDASYDKWMMLGEKPQFRARDSRSASDWEKGLDDYLSRHQINMEDVALARADVKGGTTSLVQQKKVRGMMGSFVRNIDKQVDRIDEITKEIDRLGVRALDLPWRELKTRAAGSADEKILEAYVAEISREIGKLTTGSSASIAELSVEAQKKWDKIHDVNLTLPELKKILTETKEMGRLRLESADEEIEATRQSFKRGEKGGKGGASASPQATTPVKYSKTATNSATGERLGLNPNTGKWEPIK